MTLSLARIEELAPDQGSLDAARKLTKPRDWPTLAADAGGLVWGECQGSGSSPYRVIVAEADAGYKCTCPSRKFPCKHALALMWLRVEGKASFAVAEAPDWVKDWLGRRRGPSATAPPPLEPTSETAPPRPSLAATAAPIEAAAPDPKAEARSAAQRERNRAEREASILAGLDELDTWLGDQLETGLSAFASVAHEKCRLLAKRLVDAKAGPLAARVEALPAALFAVPEAERADFLLMEFAELHLIAESYRRQETLPAALRADVRQLVGWSIARETLLADAEAPRLAARWLVLAATSQVQPDRLRRIETWLARCVDGQGPRHAVLMDFVPVSAGAVGTKYSPGESFEAELVFYPGAAPLRALIAAQTSPLARIETGWAPEHGIAGAMAEARQALTRRPWLGDWPFAARDAFLRRAGGAPWLTDEAGERGVSIAASDADLELPLTEVGPIAAFGIWDGRKLALKYAQTAIGPWVGA